MKTCFAIKWQSIQTIAKSNYALLFPTAIKIDTEKSNVSYFKKSYNSWFYCIWLKLIIPLWYDTKMFTNISNNINLVKYFIPMPI